MRVFPSGGKRGYSLVLFRGLLIAENSLIVEHGLQGVGFLVLTHGVRVGGQGGLRAPRHVGSSRTRDQTCVACIGGWILHRWPTSEALHFLV